MCNSKDEEEARSLEDGGTLIICIVVMAIMSLVIIIETLYIFRKKFPCWKTTSDTKEPDSEFPTTSTDWNPYYGNQEYYQDGQGTQINDKNQYYDYRS